jgi:O-acetyl-ADP-ribose deacetylase (regulator of RNase III)
MPFEIIDSSYILMQVDALVVFANPMLQVETNLSNQVFQAAGAERVKEACLELAPVPLGQAVATPGFSLPAKHIIHTASPHFYDGRSGEDAVLRSCYLNCMKLATALNCKSVAFPLISTGGFGYPIEEAFRIGSEVIKSYLEKHELTVYLTLFDRKVVAPRQRFGDPLELDLYRRFNQPSAILAGKHIAEVDPEIYSAIVSEISEAPPQPKPVRHSTATDLINYLGNHDETFSRTLLNLIDASGKTDPQIYKKANLTRQHFAKIRGNPNYTPSKATVLALAIALELNVEQAKDLLSRSGFTLSRAITFDLIIEYFLSRKRYDIHRINEMLFYYDQPLLGAQPRD